MFSWFLPLMKLYIKWLKIGIYEVMIAFLFMLVLFAFASILSDILHANGNFNH